ncbi:ROK family protein [Bacillus horti]|uniref:ROK family protein n=1 Tax=Caldalkalibacillus horti TaxID=77523 RepID=A0ABT9VYB8_9BACI|nr:ROK family protein [Bacillus horti]MDQ0165985.1 hypothetical protein [Bacillus horti]
MEKANGKVIKKQNLNHLRKELKRIGTATKAILSQNTGLSVVTVNSLLAELLETGEVKEDKIVPSGGGRPALTYSYNPNFRLAIVLLLNENHGEDMLVVHVVNLFGERIFKEEHVMPHYDYRQFDNVITKVISEFPKISAIGIGIPGQSIDGQITVSSHKNLIGVQLLKHLENTYQLPILLENDINAALKGYCSTHQMTNQDNLVVGLYFPKHHPPGMAIYRNGYIEKGQYGMAGEIKFLPLQIDWKSVLSDEDFIQVFCQITHITNVILAPHKIVIYQNKIADRLLSEQWQSYLMNHYMPSTPEMAFLHSFELDFYKGVKTSILQQIEEDILY